MCKILFSLNIFLICYINFGTAQNNCSKYKIVDINKDNGNIVIPNIPQGDVDIRAFFSQAVALPENTNFTGLLQPNDNRANVFNNIENGKPVDFVMRFPVVGIIPRLLHLVINRNVICSSKFNNSHASLFYLTYFLPKETVLEKEQRKLINNITALKLIDYLEPPLENSKTEDILNIKSNKQNGCASNLKTVTPFIFSDVLLQRGQFPWLAAIFQKRPRGLSFLCGGSLISTSTVISAAHCFVLSSTTANHITVYLGHHDLESFDEEGSVLSGIKKLLIHPEYANGKYSDADLALLTLKRPVTFTEFVQPICLWSDQTDENLIINRSGLIAGWGSDESGNAVSPLAKLASARIVSEGECLRSSASLRNITSSRTLCAGNRDNTGPCTGDSGGGLVLKHNDRWMLRGILSAGLTTQRRCDLREFVIYCDLAKHLPWILQNMSD